MYASHVAAGGLFLAALALGLQGTPVPHGLQKGSTGSAAALGRELAELLEASAGPAAAGAPRGGGGGGGTKAQQQQQQQQQQPAQKGKGASAASRLMRDLRTDTKQTRAGWTRAATSEHQPGAGGGGGGGGGGSRRFKPPPKKGLTKGCFGLKLDRIGSMSGLGC